VSPFAFLGASFFIGDLLNEPMNEGSYSTPLFMALMFRHCFDTSFFGTKLY
jgi:hypothetical protein